MVRAFVFQQLLDLEVIVSADDGAAGDGGYHSHVAEQVPVPPIWQHPDMKQGSAQTAAGEGKADFSHWLGHGAKPIDIEHANRQDVAGDR